MTHRKNILLCGGYNHIGIMMIEYILDNNLDCNIIIFDNLNNIMRYRHVNPIQNYYGYLENDIVQFVHGDIKEYDMLELMWQTYPIDFVINNVKFNPKNEETINLKSICNGSENLLKLCVQNNCPILFIQRDITHNSIYNDVRLNKNVIQDSLYFMNEQQKIINTFDVSKQHCIKVLKYCDYLYDKHIDFSLDIIKKLVYMEKIGDRPY